MLPAKKTTTDKRLGFIGLGFHGSRIAGRILAAGFPTAVYDSDIDKANALGAGGATVARHPGELAAEVDIVLSCLPSGAAVEAVYMGDGGVFQNASGEWNSKLNWRPQGRLRLNKVEAYAT
jgi:3-hydroxyisobutyrate dehydrogenase-like beta-hydroxyacid dehydrogenase